MQTHNRVAIKIICAILKYQDASKIEVHVLQKLKEKDPTNSQFVHLLIHSEHPVTVPSPVNASIYCTPSTIATIYAVTATWPTTMECNHASTMKTECSKYYTPPWLAR